MSASFFHNSKHDAYQWINRNVKRAAESRDRDKPSEAWPEKRARCVNIDIDEVTDIEMVGTSKDKASDQPVPGEKSVVITLAVNPKLSVHAHDGLPTKQTTFDDLRWSVWETEIEKQV